MKCPVQKLCGGCLGFAMSDEKLAAKKREEVAAIMEGWHLNVEIGKVHMAENSIAYRNKVIVGFAKDKDKKVYSGLYAPKSHKVVNSRGCRMHPAIVNAVIDKITELVGSMKLELYNERTGTGLLRHVMVRYAKSTDEIMVVFVTSSKIFPSRKNMVNELVKAFPQIKTIVQNVNPRDTSIVLQDEYIVLYGNGYITDLLCGLKISFSAASFYQIHSEQCEVLYTLARKMLQPQPNETILDTYCGVGTIGLTMAAYCRQVTGVEINKQAVANAIMNARANNIKNIRFVAMDSTRFMQEAWRVHQRYDIIILDPPRAGTSKAFIENAAALQPKKILYISCDPKTQARDLNTFRQNGYITRKIQLVDMFPRTEHIESLCVLEPKLEKSGKAKTPPAILRAKSAPVHTHQKFGAKGRNNRKGRR